MSFGSRLRERREALHMTQGEVGKLVGASASAIGNYENEVSSPKADILYQMFDALQCDANYLFQDEMGKNKPAYSAEAERVAKRYDDLEPEGKGAVRAILDYAESVRDRALPTQTRLVPLFPAAAGPGEPAQDECQETYEIPADSKAACAVRISGDSMEPYLHDGEVYLGMDKRPTDGDVVVIVADGSVYCKQYCRDSVGNLYLFSLNRERSDLDITISHSSNQFVRCWGVVDLPHRVPLP